MMVGRIIMPSSTLAVSREEPVPPKASRTSGTSTTSPKKPYTTEGMPASSCTAGRRSFTIRFDANRDRNSAVINPAGTPTTSAPAVTYTEPRMKGRMPKTSCPGFHFSPDRKSQTPIFAMPGMPLTNRNTQISATARIETRAVKVNATFAAFSFTT